MAYDDIVIGGGSAGVVLAARLSEDTARKVLLVEAGPDHAEADDSDRLTNPMTFAQSLEAWGLKATLVAERRFDYAQGKLMGGGSGVNGGLAIRGAPEDYDIWARDGAQGWGWDALLPYFRRLESDADYGAPLHGADGPLPVVRWRRAELLPLQHAFLAAAEAQGFGWTDDHNHPQSTGIGPFPMNRRGGTRISTALCYLPAGRRPANLDIRTDSLALRVMLDGGRATGVELARGGTVERVAGARVTLCAGALASPMLLQRSGVGPAALLRGLGLDCVVDNPFVGANLMDHPGSQILVAPKDARYCDPTLPAYQLGIRWSSAHGVPNDMLIGLMNYWATGYDPALRAAAGMDHVFALTCGLHQPFSRGHVRLRSADPAVPPEIDFNMLSDPRDEARMLEGLRMLRSLIRSEAMQAVAGRMLLADGTDFSDDASLGAYLRRTITAWYHASGTCRMGTDPAKGAVVDPDLRVHGIEGLHVADASVMPVIPRAPTNLTVIAVAERAADILRNIGTGRAA